MAEFVFGIGSGIRQSLSPNILAPGIGVRLLKTAAFGKAQQSQLLSEHFVGDIKELQEVDEDTPFSYLGTPILDPFTFKGGNFEKRDESGNITKVSFPDDRGIKSVGLVIPNMIIEVNQTKNIITTPIQGRDGTVKEFISRGDYLITLNGIITGQMNEQTGTVNDIGNVYPTVDVQKLIEICEVPDSLSVTSDFLSMFLKSTKEGERPPEVVITDYNIPQQIGVRNFQTFTINMLSDIPINLNELQPIRVINIKVRTEPEIIIITA